MPITAPKPCAESERLPPPTNVDFDIAGAPPSGPFKVTVQSDAKLGPFTIYSPELGEQKLPVIAWGNGGCIKNGIIFGEFLLELASHGFLVIADGAPDGAIVSDTTGDGTSLIAALNWATAENERPCSPFYRKLNTQKLAVMGQSCGGLMAMSASADARLATVVLWNSGLFERDPAVYAKLHAPMAIIDGGESDVAYQNGAADFAAIDTVPILFANQDVGHLGTYYEDNGGDYAELGIAWLRWHLYDDLGGSGKGMFVGPSCGLCSKPAWTLESKMLGQ